MTISSLYSTSVVETINHLIGINTSNFQQLEKQQLKKQRQQEQQSYRTFSMTKVRMMGFYCLHRVVKVNAKVIILVVVLMLCMEICPGSFFWSDQ